VITASGDKSHSALFHQFPLPDASPHVTSVALLLLLGVTIAHDQLGKVH
jgi:hypothetical protein